ncbi:MAG: hypothetical protein VX444_08205 [Pseudomonadota bacterium]|nr:hypothetical protein [Pseudomonadota bacterium]
MRLQVSEIHDGIAVIEPIGAMVKTTVLQQLSNVIESLIVRGRTAFLLDLSKTSRVNMSALAAIVELPAIFQRSQIAYSNLSDVVSRKLESSGVDRGLQIFSTRQQAMNSPEFQAHALKQTRAILFCDGLNQGFGRLRPELNPSMLDALGEPVLSRSLDLLRRFGIQQTFLTLTQNDQQIPAYFRRCNPENQNIVYCRMTSATSLPFVGGRKGRAHQLRQLQSEHLALDGDTVLSFGTDLADVNLAEMMRTHRHQKADFTFAMSAENGCEYSDFVAQNSAKNLVSLGPKESSKILRRPQLFETGIFIISNSAAALIERDASLHNLHDLGRKISKEGGRVLCFAHNSKFHSCATPKGYYNALCHMNRSVGPERTQRGGVDQTCYVSKGAIIKRGVELLGSCFIQDGATVGRNAVLENCVVLQNGHVESGFWGQNLLIGPDSTQDYLLTEHGAAVQNLDRAGSSKGQEQRTMASA